MNSPVAIVTGASAGIGLATTARLVASGWRVVMVARTASTLAREATRLGALAIPWSLDVADLAALAKLPGAVVERLGRLDLVVNNAGAHHRGRVLSRTEVELADLIQINLAAPIVLSRAAAPLLPAGGCIVNVASLAGMLPLAEGATYSAAKVGLRFFSKALAEELPHLRISVVSPGPVDTGFIAGGLESVSDMVFSQPMSSADDVAQAIVRCLDLPSTEIALPWVSGKLASLGYFWPGLARALQPMMRARGKAGKARYRAQLALRASGTGK